MPATFGLYELKKGYFAHLFNTEEHQNYRGVMPPTQDYHMEAMSETEQSKFRLWYKQQKDIYQWKLHYWKHVLVNIDKNTKEPVEYDHKKELLAYAHPMWIFCDVHVYAFESCF